MKKACVLLLFVMSIACATSQPPTQQRKPSSVDDRKKAVLLTRFLENNPFHENAKATRQWLLIWMIQIPDITVNSIIGDMWASLLNFLN